MLIRKLVLSILALATICYSSTAQDFPRNSQYMFNKQLYNPAAFGSEISQFNSSLIFRNQLSGISGGPKYFALWGDYRFTAKKMALGANINTFTFGITRQSEFLINYSYYIPVTRRLKLSMGLRGGLANTTVRSSDLENVWDEGDEAVTALDYNKTFAKIGVGFHLYSSGFYAGVSAPELLSGRESFDIDTDKSFLARSAYTLYAGGRILLGDAYQLLPSSIMYIGNRGTRIDASLLFEIKQYFWAGFTATTQNQYSLNAGAYISPRLKLGYAYEFTKPGEASRLNTHEIILRYSIDNLFN